MPKAISPDLRMRILRAVAAGMSQRAAARRFEVASSTVTGWLTRLRKQGALSPGTLRRARPRPLPAIDAHRGFLLGRLKEDPNLTIAELREALAGKGLDVSWSTVRTFLKRNGVRRRKGPRPGRRRKPPRKRRAAAPQGTARGRNRSNRG